MVHSEGRTPPLASRQQVTEGNSSWKNMAGLKPATHMCEASALLHVEGGVSYVCSLKRI